MNFLNQKLEKCLETACEILLFDVLKSIAIIHIFKVQGLIDSYMCRCYRLDSYVFQKVYELDC